jgi:hypothetical protein
MADDALAIALDFGAALERVGAGWVIEGSLASSVHGVPRSTVDVDIVVSLAPDSVDSLAREATEFSMDADVLREQVAAGRSFNVFHRTTITKLDLFPAVGAFERSQIARGIRVLGGRIMTPEDILLAKLRWYRMGNEVSDRQWRDVLGIVAAQHTSMDEAYLRRWADDLGVSDLLMRARSDRSGGF